MSKKDFVAKIDSVISKMDDMTRAQAFTFLIRLVEELAKMTSFENVVRACILAKQGNTSVIMTVLADRERASLRSALENKGE